MGTLEYLNALSYLSCFFFYPRGLGSLGFHCLSRRKSFHFQSFDERDTIQSKRERTVRKLRGYMSGMNVIGVSDAPLSIFPHMYKIMIIGRCGVGKTSLLWRYLYNEFKEDLRGTIIDKETKKVNVNGKDLELELWDTARLETYCTLSPQYLRDANAVIILYDITDPATYIEVKESWIGMVCAQFGEDADQRIPILLVGSKSDLIDKYDELQIRVRRKDVIEDMKQRHSHILGPIECSSKTGKNVEKLFQVLGEEIVRRDLEPAVRNKHLSKTRVNSIQNNDCKC